jgi:hypothetical protein
LTFVSADLSNLYFLSVAVSGAYFFNKVRRVLAMVKILLKKIFYFNFYQERVRIDEVKEVP